jgi:TM2 domain
MGEAAADVNAARPGFARRWKIPPSVNSLLSSSKSEQQPEGDRMSFGRKGVAPGEIAATPSRPVAAPQNHGDEIAARREAFLAAERARNGGQSGSIAVSPDNPSDPLAGLRNGVRPATRRDEAVGQSWSPMPERDARAAMQSHTRSGSSGSEKRFIFGEPMKRSVALAYLFWFIAGQASLHRFYCGQKESALMQIGLLVGSVLTGLVFVPIAAVGIIGWFVWIIADLFLIPGMMRRFKAEYAPDYSGIFA